MNRTLELGDLYNRLDYVDKAENEYIKACAIDPGHEGARERLEQLKNDLEPATPAGGLNATPFPIPKVISAPMGAITSLKPSWWLWGNLTSAYEKARKDPRFKGNYRILALGIRRPPHPPYFRRQFDPKIQGRQDLPEKGGPEPHRGPQDQQLPGPDTPGPPDGKKTNHRGNRGGPAWGGHGHRLRPLRHAM